MRKCLHFSHSCPILGMSKLEWPVMEMFMQSLVQVITEHLLCARHWS